MYLTIISHTEHYKSKNGQILGLASTVKEINYLLEIFDSITHMAMLHDGMPPANTLAYKTNVNFISIPKVGGRRFLDKVKHVFHAAKTLSIVNEHLGQADYFQFRAPTGIGVYVIPFLILSKKKKKGWFKYAGNWMQARPPYSYLFQKKLLTKQIKKVTINGKWPNQPNHCLSFENPCLTNVEIEKGKTIRKNKNFNNGIEICFVGRLEPAKGLDVMFEALDKIPNSSLINLKLVHVVGTGQLIDTYEEKSLGLKSKIKFHGLLSREGVHELFQRCHALVLPSKSEGFPKVIAEAMNYGCIPIVSDVSSIGQYIEDDKNGFILKTISSMEVANQLATFLSKTSEELVGMMENVEFLELFSYNYYNQRIKEEILQ